jgi:hypothetical protein
MLAALMIPSAYLIRNSGRDGVSAGDTLGFQRLLTVEKRKKIPLKSRIFNLKVTRLGLEPRTHTLKVYCSTN